RIAANNRDAMPARSRADARGVEVLDADNRVDEQRERLRTGVEDDDVTATQAERGDDAQGEPVPGEHTGDVVLEGGQRGDLRRRAHLAAVLDGDRVLPVTVAEDEHRGHRRTSRRAA